MAKPATTTKSAKSAKTRTRMDEFERFYPASRPEWRMWLAENHDKAPGVWVIRYKISANQPTISYEDVVEEALCFGWIDSLARKLDAESHIQMVTPRKPKSVWSKINKERVERLITQGLMAPAGLTKIELAKANGSWLSLDAVEAMTVPADLADALAANLDAKRYWDAFPPSSQKIILQWIAAAKRPETRARRIEEAVRLATQNIRANHYRQ